MPSTTLLACTLRYGWIGLVGSIVSCGAGRVDGDIEECGCGSYHNYSITSTGQGTGALSLGERSYQLSLQTQAADYALPLPGQERQFPINLIDAEGVPVGSLLLELGVPPRGFSVLRAARLLYCPGFTEVAGVSCDDGSNPTATPLEGHVLLEGDIEQADVEGIYRNRIALTANGDGVSLHLIAAFEESFHDGRCY